MRQICGPSLCVNEQLHHGDWVTVVQVNLLEGPGMRRGLYTLKSSGLFG